MREKRFCRAGILCGGISLILWLAATQTEGFGEWYAGKVYPLLVFAVGGCLSAIPCSVGELLLYFTGAGALVYLLRRIMQMIQIVRHREEGRSFAGEFLRECGRTLADLTAFLGILALIFMLGGGINYHRMTFAECEGLETENITREELEKVCEIMVEQVNQAAEELSSDSIPGKKDLAKIARMSIMDLSDTFDSLAGYFPEAKPVLGSRLLSMQKVTGIYSPFTIEANYNTEIPTFEEAFTICHELSHLKGYMREDEANFIAWASCYCSYNNYFRYSGALEGFIYAGNALYKYDKERYLEIRSGLCEMAEADLAECSSFWHQFDGPVADTHEKVNNTYLKANSQSDGVESYGRVVQLMVAYLLRVEA